MISIVHVNPIIRNPVSPLIVVSVDDPTRVRWLLMVVHCVMLSVCRVLTVAGQCLRVSSDSLLVATFVRNVARLDLLQLGKFATFAKTQAWISLWCVNSFLKNIGVIHFYSGWRVLSPHCEMLQVHQVQKTLVQRAC